MRLLDGHRLYTAPCGNRTKWTLRRHIPLYFSQYSSWNILIFFSEGYAENYASHTAEALSRVTQGALKKPNRRISVGLSQNGISLSVEDLRRRKTRIVVVGQENVGKSGWFSGKLFHKLRETFPLASQAPLSLYPWPVNPRPIRYPWTDKYTHNFTQSQIQRQLVLFVFYGMWKTIICFDNIGAIK